MAESTAVCSADSWVAGLARQKAVNWAASSVAQSADTAAVPTAVQLAVAMVAQMAGSTAGWTVAQSVVAKAGSWAELMAGWKAEK